LSQYVFPQFIILKFSTHPTVSHPQRQIIQLYTFPNFTCKLKDAKKNCQFVTFKVRMVSLFPVGLTLDRSDYLVE